MTISECREYSEEVKPEKVSPNDNEEYINNRRNQIIMIYKKNADDKLNKSIDLKA